MFRFPIPPPPPNKNPSFKIFGYVIKFLSLSVLKCYIETVITTLKPSCEDSNRQYVKSFWHLICGT